MTHHELIHGHSRALRVLRMPSALSNCSPDTGKPLCVTGLQWSLPHRGNGPKEVGRFFPAVMAERVTAERGGR